MIAELILLVFYSVLAVGQGRQVLKCFNTGMAGWGRSKFARSTNPKGFLAMALLDVMLFGGACVAAVTMTIVILT
jgi:hypothetical protein